MKEETVYRNGDAKWVIAFWVMTAVCFGGLVFIGNQAIAIDSRARSAVDIVDTKSLTRYTENRLNILQLMKENSEAHMIMMGDLREIKTKMGIQK